MLRPFLFALAFLTRLPLPAFVHDVDARTIKRGPLWFPIVGALVALTTGLITIGLAHAFTPWVSVLVALSIEARLTGAMHEDALADCFDALGGGWTRERTLEIFKDSRLGTYGVLGLVLGVGLRAATMVALLERSAGPASLLGGFVLAGFLGRYLMLWFLHAVPPLKGRASLAGTLGEGLSVGAITLAGWPLIGLFLWLHGTSLWTWALGLALLGLLFATARSIVLRRLGGSTGDVLGCVAFLGQLAVLIALSAKLG